MVELLIYKNLFNIRMESTGIAPVKQSQRIEALDSLRGIALLGILLMNIPFFALPERYSEPFRTDTESVNFWVRAVILVVFEGKMRALFSMIFGAGILLFLMKKEASPKAGLILFFRRMWWLILFGLADAHLLLWEGDILFHYGLIGCIAVLFRKMKPKYLVLGLPIVVLVEFIGGTYFYQGIRDKHLAYRKVKTEISAGTHATPAQQKVLDEWRQTEKDFIPNDKDIAENIQKMKSGYGRVAERVRENAIKFEFTYLLFGLWDPLVLMLLGMALHKTGFFTFSWPEKSYWKAVWIGYGIGLPLVLIDFYIGFKYYPNLAASMEMMDKTPVPWTNLIYPFQRILLVMAHASLVLLLIQKGFFKSLFHRLAAVGQLALSNYIMQAVFGTLFFFGYGLNYYAELEYYQVFYFVLAVWVIQLIVSPIWLKYYRFGPLEWLWRSLTYWKIQPFRR